MLGISATFVREGLSGLISDPFGASLCLVLVGLFFARPLYRMNLLTIGDFYRQRFDRRIELIASICIALSYLGWVSAQITALGLVFNVLSDSCHQPRVGHDHRRERRARLYAVRRHVVRRGNDLHPDDRHRARAALHRLARERTWRAAPRR